MPRLLYLFALCNLVIGTGAFVISGVLVPISEGLQVSVAAAGQAMTVYALATAVLAPLALVLTGGWPRRRALWFGMGVFALGNLVCALADNLPVLLAGRALMGVGAMFTPVAAGIAVALVEPARRGRALSIVFLGVSPETRRPQRGGGAQCTRSSSARMLSSSRSGSIGRSR